MTNFIRAFEPTLPEPLHSVILHEEQILVAFREEKAARCSFYRGNSVPATTQRQQRAAAFMMRANWYPQYAKERHSLSPGTAALTRCSFQTTEVRTFLVPCVLRAIDGD